MSKFEQHLEQAKQVYFPQEARANKTDQMINQLMEGKFANWAKNFDQEAEGGGLASLNKFGQDMVNVFRNKGDVQLDKSLKDQWGKMISSQQRMYSKQNNVLNQDKLDALADTNNDVASLRYITGKELFYKLGWLKQTSYKDWDQLTRGKWPRNMHGQSERVTPEDPRWDDYMQRKWNRLPQQYKDQFNNDFNKWDATERLKHQPA